MDKRTELFLNNQFLVSIGVGLYSFAKVSNLSASYEVEALAQGGNNRTMDFLTKPKSKADTLILERGVMRSSRLDTDMLLSLGTPVKNATIMIKSQGMIRKVYYFDYGIITKWDVTDLDALGKDVLIRKLEITHSGLKEI